MAEPTVFGEVWERDGAQGRFGVRGTRDGAHQLTNESDAVVRYLMVSTTTPADLVEYPDSFKIAAMGGGFRTPGAASHMLATENELGYFEPDKEPTR
jgi:uncharacterized cupin superfamily protein